MAWLLFIEFVDVMGYEFCDESVLDQYIVAMNDGFFSPSDCLKIEGNKLYILYGEERTAIALIIPDWLIELDPYYNEK